MSKKMALCLCILLAGCSAELSDKTKQTRGARQPGLWQITMEKEGMPEPVDMKACVNSKDVDLLHIAGMYPIIKGCSFPEKVYTHDGFFMEKTCVNTNPNFSVHSKMNVTLKGDRAFTQSNSEDEVEDGQKTTTLSTLKAKWMGRCGLNQESGDYVFSNNSKVNLHKINF